MSKAFDLAMFIGAPVNVGDGVVVTGVTSPFPTKFAPVAQGALPGVVVGASMPAAVAKDQILISGPGPTYAWSLGTNPAAAAAVPPPTARYQVLLSDAALTWQDATINTLMGLGNAVTTTAGGDFTPAAQLVFQTTATASVRIDGRDPNLSIIDNFGWDAGTF
jgi:hypothetical protein